MNEDNEDNDDNGDNKDNLDNDDNWNIEDNEDSDDMTLKEQSKRLVTRDLTLETLITFLTIENNNINIYIVTLE